MGKMTVACDVWTSTTARRVKICWLGSQMCVSCAASSTEASTCLLLLVRPTDSGDDGMGIMGCSVLHALSTAAL